MIKPDWNDCDGHAELAKAKRKAKASLVHIVDYRGDDGWENAPERNREIVLACIHVLRDDLLAWARS